MSPTADAADEKLVEAWRLLMGMDQRWRWPEVSTEQGITQAGLRALLAIDPSDPRPMRDLALCHELRPVVCHRHGG